LFCFICNFWIFLTKNLPSFEDGEVDGETTKIGTPWQKIFGRSKQQNPQTPFIQGIWGFFG